jgi:hypothetical protein
MTFHRSSARRECALSFGKTALLAATLLIGVAANAFADGSISGRVTRSSDGTGIAGTVIQFYDFNSNDEDPAATTTTDGTGHYTINLPASTYGILTQDTNGYINEIYNNLQCSAVCDTSLLLEVVVTNGGALTNIDFALELGGRITGQVTNANGGAAIAGVTVYFVNSDAGSDNDHFPFTMAVTDALGNYTSNAGTVTGNIYVVTSNTVGFQDEVYDNIKCPGNNCDVQDIGALVPVTQASGASGINFALDVGGGITGTVKDAGNNPLANVGVRIFDATGNDIGRVFTNGLGVYTASGLATGNYYAMTQNALGFVDQLYNLITCIGGECNPLGPPAGTPIAVTAGATTGNINFALVAGGTISGTVKDAGNNPLANVNVHINDATGNFVTDTFTNGAGFYAAGGLATGNYYAKTNEAPGVVDVVYPNGVCAGGSCNVTQAGGTLIAVTVGATTPNINFVLSPGGTVTGMVTKAVGGAPVDAFVGFNMVNAAGQNIFVGGTNTDGTGLYSVVLPPGANYGLVNNAPEGLANQLYHGVPCATALATGFTTCNSSAVGTPINVVAGATLNNIDFALQPGGAVSGTVTVGGVATGSIQVQIFTLSGTQVGQVQSLATAPIGVYTFTNLPPGQYYLRTNTGGAAINQMTGGVVCVQCNVTNTPGGTPITITAGVNTSNTNFALVNGGRITGTITNANTAAVLGSIPVQFFNSAGIQMGTFNSNATTGVYFSAGLPAGNYFVKTAAPVLQNFIDEAYNDVPCVPCNVRVTTPVAVPASGNTAPVNFALAAGGSITGTATAAGVPVLGIPIQVYDSTGVIVKTTTTDASGNYTVGGLPTGSYFVRTNTNSLTQNYVIQFYNGLPFQGSAVIATPVDVTVGATRSGVNFALVAGAALSGSVKATGSLAPIQNAQITVYSGTGSFMKTGTTDFQGNYTVTGLAAGNYYVSTSSPGPNPPFYVDELYNNLPCVGCLTISQSVFPYVTIPCPTACFPTGGTQVSITNGATHSGVDFVLDSGAGSITGAVTSAATGVGLLNVRVSFYKSNGDLVKSVTTVANTGGYTVRGLAPGTYYARTVVSPATPNYADEAYNDVPCAPCNVLSTTGIVVSANNTTSGIDFALASGGSISGMVVDQVGGFPLSGTDVLLYNGSSTLVKTTAIGISGKFTFDGLPAGTYYAHTQAPAFLGPYVNELFDNILCVVCTPASGTPIVVTNGATRTGVNFLLLKPPTIVQVTNVLTRISTSVAVPITVGSGVGAAGLILTASSSNQTLVTNATLVFSGSGASRTLTITPVAGRKGVAVITVSASDSTGTTSRTFVVLVGRPAPADVNGDGKSDVTVFRPSTGIWYLRNIVTGLFEFYQWGLDGDVPVTNDYDGDGKSDVAVYRPSTGIWYIRNSSDGSLAFLQWGLTGDIPVTGDYDGDGKADSVVFRPSTGIWYVRDLVTNTASFYQWGLAGDIPVAADYDGDGKTDVAVYRPSTGIWYIRNSSDGSLAFLQWGLPGSGDIPTPGDYDGDGKADAAVFRPSTGIWYVRDLVTNTATFYQWGIDGDVPVPGDFDGDGKTDVAVFRPSTSIWYVLPSSAPGAPGFYQWGITGDVPILKR